MNLPKTVRVLGSRYKVVLSEGLDSDGAVDCNDQVIQINSGQCDQAKAEALLHEVLHIMEYRIFGTCDDEREDAVIKLTTCLTDFLSSNKTAIRSMLKVL